MFEEGQGHYGAEHICGVIRSRVGKASFECVKAIMKENGLKSSHCRRRRRILTNSRAARKDSYNNLTQDLVHQAFVQFKVVLIFQETLSFTVIGVHNIQPNRPKN